MTTGKMSRKPSDTHRATLMYRATRMLAQAGKPDIQHLIAPKPEIVVLRCPACKSRATITKERFVAGDIPLCCERKMLYHREQGDEHIHA